MASVWSATAEIPQYGALEGGATCDVVVVGGGWIGSTTSLLLTQEGADVLLVEAGRLASRTNANTTGKVTSQHGAIYSTLINRHGTDVARLYTEANQGAVAQVAELAERLTIDYELATGPSFAYTTDPNNDLTSEARAASSLGLPAHFVDGKEIGVPATAAVRFDDQLQLHPVRYLAGDSSTGFGSTWNSRIQPEYRWSAHDHASADLLPYAGRAPGGDAILVATGMHKWGLASGTAAAGVLRDLILDRDNPAAALYHAGRRTIGAYRNQDGELQTVKPVCTHLGCSLTWNDADTTWACNCHGSRFSPDGTVLDGPATTPLAPG